MSYHDCSADYNSYLAEVVWQCGLTVSKELLRTMPGYQKYILFLVHKLHHERNHTATRWYIQCQESTSPYLRRWYSCHHA